MPSALTFDHIAFKRLDPFFITLNDLIINGNVIASFKLGEFLLARQLLVYICDGVHFSDFRTAKVGVNRESSKFILLNLNY